jgi:uncharacterized protein (DUF4415 family)
MKKKSSSKPSETDWAALAQMQDADIALDEIPEVSADQMARARLRVDGQPVAGSKIRVNIYLDAAVIEYFKSRAGGRGYQTLINETLKDSIRREKMEDLLRRVIREELQPYGQE